MEKKKLSDKLDGQRIYLKKHEEGLAQTMYEYIEKDRERLARFLPWAEFIKEPEDELNYIKMTHEKWEDGTLFDYGIFLKENDLYIGNVGVHSILWAHDCAEIGYWILGDFEGKGYMSEAVSILDQHLFQEGFHRVQIRCSDLNERSEGVPLRCGYTFEGVGREDRIEKGEYRNTKTFSKLVTD